MLFGMIAIIGVKTLKDEEVEFNFQNCLVIATILILGLFSEQLSSVFGFTIGIPINEAVNVTGLSFAAIVGVFLNSILTLLNNQKKI